MIISKELLSEVLNISIIKVAKSHKNNNVSYWIINNNCKTNINIYELANRVKLWMNNNKHGFNICYRDDWWDRLESRVEVDLYNSRKVYGADTEPEAIFKAGEWVLEQLKENK